MIEKFFPQDIENVRGLIRTEMEDSINNGLYEDVFITLNSALIKEDEEEINEEFSEFGLSSSEVKEIIENSEEIQSDIAEFIEGIEYDKNDYNSRANTLILLDAAIYTLYSYAKFSVEFEKDEYDDAEFSKLSDKYLEKWKIVTDSIERKMNELNYRDYIMMLKNSYVTIRNNTFMKNTIRARVAKLNDLEMIDFLECIGNDIDNFPKDIIEIIKDKVNKSNSELLKVTFNNLRVDGENTIPVEYNMIYNLRSIAQMKRDAVPLIISSKEKRKIDYEKLNEYCKIVSTLEPKELFIYFISCGGMVQNATTKEEEDIVLSKLAKLSMKDKRILARLSPRTGKPKRCLVENGKQTTKKEEDRILVLLKSKCKIEDLKDNNERENTNKFLHVGRYEAISLLSRDFSIYYLLEKEKIRIMESVQDLDIEDSDEFMRIREEMREKLLEEIASDYKEIEAYNKRVFDIRNTLNKLANFSNEDIIQMINYINEQVQKQQSDPLESGKIDYLVRYLESRVVSLPAKYIYKLKLSSNGNGCFDELIRDRWEDYQEMCKKFFGNGDMGDQLDSNNDVHDL